MHQGHYGATGQGRVSVVPKKGSFWNLLAFLSVYTAGPRAPFNSRHWGLQSPGIMDRWPTGSSGLLASVAALTKGRQQKLGQSWFPAQPRQPRVSRPVPKGPVGQPSGKRKWIASVGPEEVTRGALTLGECSFRQGPRGGLINRLGICLGSRIPHPY